MLLKLLILVRRYIIGLFNRYPRIRNTIPKTILTIKKITDGPKVVYIGISNDCNFKCLFCLEHSFLKFDISSPFYRTKSLQGKDYFSTQLNYNLFKKVIDDAYALGTSSVCFTGNGETFLHQDFLRMVEYVKAKRIDCSISTNGELLTPDIAKYLVEIGIDNLNVSLNASSLKTHQIIHQINRQSFSGIVENIKIISSYKKSIHKTKPLLSISFVICKVNYTEIVQMVRLGRDIGVQQIRFYNLLYCKAREKLMSPLLLQEDDFGILKNLLLEALLLAKDNQIITNIPLFLKKLQQPNASSFLVRRKAIEICQIRADGVVYPYDFPYEMGNINSQSLIMAWYSWKYINFRRKIIFLSTIDGKMHSYPFCRRCNAYLYDRNFCTIQC